MNESYKIGVRALRGFNFFLFVLVVIVAALGFYWTKCQLGIDFIDGFSWEERFPVLNLLQRQVPVIHPRAGEVLIHTSFDETFPLLPWGPVYSGRKKWVTQKIVVEGRTDAKALAIENLADDFWVKEYCHWVAVQPGDRLAYHGFVRIEGRARAYMGITLYDARKHVIEWNSAGTSASGKEGSSWKELSAEGTVPEGVAFVRFRISGDNQGKVYVDDIRFWQEK